MKLTPKCILLAGLHTLTIRAGAVTYSIDGGTSAAALGDNTAGWSAAAINHFTVVAGGQNLISVDVLFGGNTTPANLLAGGEPVVVALWSDPNGDGDPTDASLLTFSASTIASIAGTAFQTIPITPQGLSVGQSFFAGVVYQTYGAGVNPQAVSVAGGTPSDAWLAYNSAGTININNPGSAPVFGNFGATVSAPTAIPMLRATGVPEPGSALLAGVAALGLLRRRRD